MWGALKNPNTSYTNVSNTGSLYLLTVSESEFPMRTLLRWPSHSPVPSTWWDPEKQTEKRPTLLWLPFCYLVLPSASASQATYWSRYSGVLFQYPASCATQSFVGVFYPTFSTLSGAILHQMPLLYPWVLTLNSWFTLSALHTHLLSLS